MTNSKIKKNSFNEFKLFYKVMKNLKQCNKFQIMRFFKFMGVMVPNSSKKKTVNVDKETFERFDYLYPEIGSIFINRALKLALQDKKYFEDVFFNKLFIEVK